MVLTTISVLIVDSDARQAQVMRDALIQEAPDWPVQIANSVSAARTQLVQHSFDAVITRHTLPDGRLDGLLVRLGGGLESSAVLVVLDPNSDLLPDVAVLLRQGYCEILMRDASGRYLSDLAHRVRLGVVRHASTQALVQQARRLEGAVAGAGIGIWEWSATEHRTRVNARWCDMLGYAPEDVVLDDAVWHQWIHPQDLPGFLAGSGVRTFAARYQPEHQYEAEFRMQHREGHWVWIQSRWRVIEWDTSGQPALLAGTHTDISERKKVEHMREQVQAELLTTSELLERKTNAMEDMLDSISQGICKIDSNKRISFYNQKVLAMLDLPEHIFASEPTQQEVGAFQVMRGDFRDMPVLTEAMHRQIVGQDDKQSTETYVRKTKSGAMLEVRTNYLPDGSSVRTYSDVSSYFETQTALRQSEMRFRALVELSSDWYWEQDAEFRFVRFEGGTEIAGYQRLEGIGKTRWEIGSLSMSSADWDAHEAVLKAHQEFRDLEIKRLAPDGSEYWISTSGAPIFDATGEFCGYRGVGRNISERKRIEAQIEHLAYYDVLTGLPNRRMLIERLQHAMTSSNRSRLYGALLFIDLDHFKALNDTHGHGLGDQLLAQVGQRLRESVRDVDMVGRLGGDEFVVLLEELSSDEDFAASQVQQVGEKIVATIDRQYLLVDHEYHCTSSIGVTLFLGTQESSDELLKRADVAMYQAKASGRNALRFFDPAMQAAVLARSLMEKELRQSLQRAELVLHFQPVVDIHATMTGVEALVRWQHPVRGLVMPDTFIELAEQTGLIFSLGEWVLRAACQQLARWSEAAETRHLSMAVNVSARQMRQADFVAQVKSEIARTGANPNRLKIEITESMLLTDVEDIICKMSELKSIGVSFSLDDFGTGYSSLSYLKRLPLDQLKIDQSFVRDVLTDPNDAAIAQTILALASSLGLQVVAEGVENWGQHDFLLQSGCKSFQGYLFGQPIPIKTLHEVM